MRRANDGFPGCLLILPDIIRLILDEIREWLRHA